MIRLTKHQWLFIAIILVAIAMRFNEMMHAGYTGDMLNFNAPWAKDIHHFGLFQIYAYSPTVNYPPIFLFIITFTSWLVPPFYKDSLTLGFVIVTKLFSVIAEVVLIGVVYSWIPKNTRLKWIIPLILGIYPGVIMTTANWGQTDSMLTLLLVLTIIAINRNQMRLTWIWFAVAMLMKFQAIVLLPMIGILSVRRFGLRPTAHSLLIGLGVFSIVYAPFVVGSGFANALRPFTSAVDYNAVVTANAFNLWMLLTPSIWNLLPNDLRRIPTDKSLLFGTFTLKQVGLFLLGNYVLIIAILIWKHYFEHREFVWAAALYLGFFMLPTQMHERYLFPAAVLSVIAIVQDRRMWLIALPLITAYTSNIVLLPFEHFIWLGLDLKTPFYGWGLASAAINLLCLAGITFFVLCGDKKQADTWISGDK